MAKRIPENQSPNQEWQTPSLSPSQVNAAIMQAQGQSVKRTAEAVGVSCWTITQWSKKPEYRALIASYLRDTLEGSKRLALSAQKAALQRLTGIVTNPESTDGDAISAARVILSVPTWNAQEIGETDPQQISADEEARNKMIQKTEKDLNELMAVLSRN